MADLLDHDVVETVAPGRKHLRFANGTANAGPGALEVSGRLPQNADGTQTIIQRLYREDGTWFEREAGRFVFHPEHRHIHVEGWAAYRLREVLPEGEAGALVAEGDKVSSCLLDGAVYDPSVENFEMYPRYISCSLGVQGISVGWIDIYTKNLPGQSIDVTDVPDGVYWLESEADPDDAILEADEENNTARVLVTLGTPPSPPDPLEPNDSPLHVRGLPPGAPGSANLGPSNPKRVLRGLSLHDGSDQDFFRFYGNHSGSALEFVQIDYDPAAGDADAVLLDDQLQTVGLATRTAGSLAISLAGYDEGWYFAHVFSPAGRPLAEYTLTVVPPRNEPPSLRVVSPGAQGSRRIHAADLFSVTWEHEDAEGDEAWVSVYLSREPVLDGGEMLLETSLFTAAGLGVAVINSAELEPGSYWVYCAITDGGSTAGAWSEGTVSFLALLEDCAAAETDADCNRNLVADGCEIASGVRADCDENGRPDECDVSAGGAPGRMAGEAGGRCERPLFHRGDANDDGRLNVADASRIFAVLFLGAGGLPCWNAADADNDGAVNLTDGIRLLRFLFAGGPGPAPPGGPGQSCGADPEPAASPGNLGCESYGSCS
jgi:hypothetical protein